MTLIQGNRERAWWLAFFVAAVAIHARSLGVGYFWDDYELLAQNEALRLNPFTAWLRPLYSSTPSPYYRPLPMFLLAALGKVAGFDNTLILHAAQLCFSLAVIVAVSYLAIRLLPPLQAGLSVALFAFFPTHVEAFAWLSAFPDVLAFLFGALFFIRLYDEIEGERPSVVTVAVLAAALLSKESAAGLLVFALAVDIDNIKASPLRRLLRFHGPLVATFCAYFLLHHVVVTQQPHLLNGWPYIVGDTFFRYMGKLAWPWPLSILLGDKTGEPVLTALAGYVLMGLGLWAALRTGSKPVRFCLIFALAMFLPVSNLFATAGEASFAERYMLPLVLSGSLLLGAGFKYLPAKFTVGVGGVLVVVFMGSTWARYGDWQSPTTLWRTAIAAAPNAVAPYLELAREAKKRDDVALAVCSLESGFGVLEEKLARGVTRAEPSWLAAKYHWGAAVFVEAGRFDAALDAARNAYRFKPGAEVALMGILIHDRRMDSESALAGALRAVRAHPEHPGLRLLAALLLYANEAPMRAVTEAGFSQASYAEAVAAVADKRGAERAIAFARQGLVGTAVQQAFALKESMTADQAIALSRLAARAGMWQAAVAFFEDAVNHDGGLVDSGVETELRTAYRMRDLPACGEPARHSL